jgi:hypothetical protein
MSILQASFFVCLFRTHNVLCDQGKCGYAQHQGVKANWTYQVVQGQRRNLGLVQICHRDLGNLEKVIETQYIHFIPGMSNYVLTENAKALLSVCNIER